MTDNRRRGVDQPVVGERALEQRVRRVDEAEGPGFGERAVGRERLEQADRLDRSLDGEIGEVRRVVAVLVEDRLGARFAIGGDHFVEVIGYRRIAGMNRMVHAGVAMAVAPDADAHLLEEFVGRHERRINLDRGRLLVAAGRHPLPHLDRGAGRGFVSHHRMTGVGQILDQHLPVAIVHVAQHAAGDFQPPGRRAIHHIVDRRQALAEIVLEVRPDVAHLGEDEAAIIFYIPHRRDAFDGDALFQPGVLVALAQRDREQRAVGLERPGMIWTAEEFPGVAAGVDGDARALVRAAVVEDVHHAVAVADHQDRLLADRRAIIIACVGHLAVVTDINPRVGEQMLHLQVENFLVDVNVAMDLGFAHQLAHRCGVAVVFAHARSPIAI